jgi:hypothetical protein
VIRKFPSNSLITPRYFECGEFFHPILSRLTPLPRLLIHIIKGEVYSSFIVIVFRGSALELALVLPEGRGLELILRGGVRAEPGCTEIQTNNGVGDRKKEATTGLLQY